jgi:hypothetical protein
MGRGWSILIVVGIVLASIAAAAVIIWQASVHAVPLFYVLGPMMIAIGFGFSLLNLSVSDDYLRQHFGGQENAARMRRMWRDGWIGMLIGVVMIAWQYFVGGSP